MAVQAIRERTRLGVLLKLRKEQVILRIFLLVPVAFILAFTVFPLIYNVVLSFQEVTVFTLTRQRPFIGLENYRMLLEDISFRQILKNSMIFTLGSVVFQFVLGLSLALFFAIGFRWSETLRGLIVAGWMVPPLVVGTVWKWILNTDFGVLNYFLKKLGVIDQSIGWLVSPDTAMLGVIMANIWFGIPFNLMLLAAGLAGVPSEVYDAAKVDGANAWGRLRYVTLPLLRPAILATLILGFIYTLRVFDLIWVMTRGGPVNATNVLPVWSYQLSFEFFDYGKGAAIANIILVILFAMSLLYVAFAVSKEEEQG